MSNDASMGAGFVSVRFSKTAMADASVMAKLRQPMAFAVPTANRIKRRMVEEGRSATPPKPYKGEQETSQTRKRRNYVVSPEYQAAAGVSKRWWKSSAEFHAAAGVKSGSAVVTGGMWKGLVVRNHGGDGAVITFDGSSLGAKSTHPPTTAKVKGEENNFVFLKVRGKDGEVRAMRKRQLSRYKRDDKQGHKKGDIKFRAKPTLIRNSVKAGTVFKFSRIGLVQPNDEEFDAIVGAATCEATRLIHRCFDDSNRTARDGDYLTEVSGDKALLVSIINGLEK